MHSIGVPKEDKNLFENRTAVIPAVTAQLVKNGIPVFVQRSARRAFIEKNYSDAGAMLVDNLDKAGLIVGVKEPNINTVDGKIYMIFSHTIKGQTYNMPLLQQFLDTGATLIDYELITDSHGNRLVAFGRFAGIAGMNDTLWTLGQKLNAGGIPNPFSRFMPAFMHANLTDLFSHLKRLGKMIAGQTIPGITGPFIIGIAGYGRTGRGSQETLNALGAIQVKPEELDNVKGPGIFYTMFEEHHMVNRKDGGFDLQEYYAHPELYHSIFEKYLPKLTVLMNCIYWNPKYPRLITRDFIRHASIAPDFLLKVIGDTSCDPQGGCEITDHCTDPGNPAFTYIPEDDAFANAIISDGITIFAVDNLPAEVAIDSSIAFSTTLQPYLLTAATTDFDRTFRNLDLPPELKRAIIVLHGELTPAFKYLKTFLEKENTLF